MGLPRLWIKRDLVVLLGFVAPVAQLDRASAYGAEG